MQAKVAHYVTKNKITQSPCLFFFLGQKDQIIEQYSIHSIQIIILFSTLTQLEKIVLHMCAQTQHKMNNFP